MPLRRALARFNRKVANPVTRLFTGWLPPFAIVNHRGRVTGRAYATPVVAFRTADVLVIGVLYGTTSDWVRNVLAAGGAEIKRLGSARTYQHPRLIADAAWPLLPRVARTAYRLLGVRAFVAVTSATEATARRE